RVLQLGLPVDLDGARDVAAVICGGVLVDLDEDDVVCVEVLLGPVGRDQGGLATHECSLSQGTSFWAGRVDTRVGVYTTLRRTRPEGTDHGSAMGLRRPTRRKKTAQTHRSGAPLPRAVTKARCAAAPSGAAT